MGKAKSATTRRSRAKKTSSRSTSAQPGSLAAPSLSPPHQSPPIEREYLRALVGKQGRPESLDKPAKGKQAGDYLVQLATFHIRPRWRG
jgi:hypothetical protein